MTHEWYSKLCRYKNIFETYKQIKQCPEKKTITEIHTQKLICQGETQQINPMAWTDMRHRCGF